MATQFSIEDGRKWKRRFFTIWTGQALSLMGSMLVQFALVWYLTVETGSATVLAMASLAAFLPQVVLGPLVGNAFDALLKISAISQEREAVSYWFEGLTPYILVDEMSVTAK